VERRTEARLDRYADLIWREAEARALPPDLVRAVIRAESRGCPRAVSAAGAKGLMQVMPAAERDVCDRLGLAPGDLFKPEHNIRVGTAYLAGLVERFGGDLHLALAAYHWGPGRVEALRREHPALPGRDLIRRHGPRVTARYLRQVLKDRPVVLPGR
jgi:soluble lytic murein transglycosylase-like protein